MNRLAAAALAGLALLAAPASAQLDLPAPSDAELADLVSQVRSFLPRAVLPDGSHVPPETKAELAQPIVADDLARAVVRRGTLSGMLAGCKGDAEARSFLPMMAEARARGDLTPKQLAFIGMLHGAVQGAVASSIPPGACTPALLSQIDAELKSPALAAR